MNLEHCLMETETSHLRAVAEFVQVDTGANPSRSDVISKLRYLFLTDTFGVQVFEKLNLFEKEILYQILEAGGSIPVSEIEKSWGADDPEVARRWFWHRTVSSGLSRLRLSGLLYCVRHQDYDTRAYVLPKEFHSIVCIPPFEGIDHDYAPYHYQATGFTILSDVFYYLQYLSEYRVKVLTSGTPAKRHKLAIIKKLEALIPSDRKRDEPYIDLLFTLADKLGFITRRRNIFEVTSHASQWFDLSQTDQIKDLYSAWKHLGNTNEINVSDNVVLTAAGIQHPVQRVKHAITSIIDLLPLEKWISLETVSDHFKHRRPYFFRPDLSPGLWRLKDKQTQQIIPDDAVWEHLERHLIITVTTRRLAWLGLLDVGLSKHGKPEALMLNQLGLYVFGNSNSNSAEMNSVNISDPSLAVNKVIVQPDFEILAPAGLVLSVRNRLENIAEVISGGHMQQYRITRNTIASALESGIRGFEIIEFLELISRTTVPQNVKTSIEDWIDEFGKINVSKGIVLTTSDHYIMKELFAHSAIYDLLGHRISSRAVWISKNNVNCLFAELKRIGYLPKIDPELRKSADLASISLNIDRDATHYLLGLLQDEIRNAEKMTRLKNRKTVTELIEKLKEVTDNE